MSEQQIPVVVLAGFLGAGKTTLLNHLLHHSGGTRIGAIVNDFGSIEIDAMAVAGQLGDATVSLGGGCLCCAADVTELDGFLDRLTRPEAGIDLIVVEASGLAEPQELIRMVMASENRRIVYGGLVEVVDAVEFDATLQRHPEIERHLAVADLVVVNKADRLPAAAYDKVRETVQSLTDRAAVVPSSYGRIDMELLFDRKPTRERLGQLSFDDLHAEDRGGPEGGRPGAGDADHDCAVGHCRRPHLHTGYQSLEFTADGPMHPRRFLDVLDRRPQGLYRVKGWADFGDADPRNRYVLHAVGRFLRFSPEPWRRGQERGTQLVLIGSGFDAAVLERELGACLRGPGDEVSEHAMWGVLRYVTEATPRGLGARDQGDAVPGEPAVLEWEFAQEWPAGASGGHGWAPGST